MFKKVSIFTDAHVRKCVAEKNQETIKALGYALMFPGDLIRLYLGRPCYSLEELPTYLQKMRKFFDGCHAEYHDTQHFISGSHRIEALIQTYIFDRVEVTVSCYFKGVKNPPFVLRVVFSSTGEIGVITTSYSCDPRCNRE